MKSLKNFIANFWQVIEKPDRKAIDGMVCLTSTDQLEIATKKKAEQRRIDFLRRTMCWKCMKNKRRHCSKFCQECSDRFNSV